MRPIIGVTSFHDWKEERIRQNETYIKAVEKSGGVPILLPVTDSEEAIDRFLDVIDGLVISGGPDIGANFFNEEPHKDVGAIAPLMDRFELSITRKAIEKQIPIFGICRGLQLLNVAMGGTLYQDIYSQYDTKIQHRQMAPRSFTAHSIEIEEDSLLYKLFGKSLRVNTFHHQALKDVANGLKVVAYAPDGIIEAVEGVGEGFIVGVQWHPEGMWNSEYNYDSLFDEFISKCK
ncbi:MAG: gamma-glutamyl-gamma-aminobutyrate hydrolase family protein [Clostridia bacterium]